MGESIDGFISHLFPLWALGNRLEAPAFQNKCMDGCRISYMAGYDWPFPTAIENLYKVNNKDSKL